MITEQANPLASPRYSGHRMYYARNERAVTYALGQTWDDPDPCTSGTQVTYAYEFRYDGARQRYLTRKYDPAALESSTLTVLSETWSNYDGNTNHDEVTKDAAGTVTGRRSFLSGLGRFDWDLGTGLPDETTIRYLRNDLIGTTRNTANIAGNPGTVRVATAFGERVSGPTDRYGYAGAWGYQTDDTGDFPFLHVGARYYDPGIGRFLQRDPIAIAGGLNVYAYAGSAPTGRVNPNGLAPEWATDALIDWTLSQGRFYDPGPFGRIGVFVGFAQFGVFAGIAAWPVVVAAVSSGGTALGTKDPGFLRWGQGLISRPGELKEFGWRIAFGGPKGDWPFHIHIHRNSLKYLWEWFLSCL